MSAGVLDEGTAEAERKRLRPKEGTREEQKEDEEDECLFVQKGMAMILIQIFQNLWY